MIIIKTDSLLYCCKVIIRYNVNSLIVSDYTLITLNCQSLFDKSLDNASR